MCFFQFPDPHYFNADPDPAFYFNADLDLELACKNIADLVRNPGFFLAIPLKRKIQCAHLNSLKAPALQEKSVA
jgi:hypothetical protein